MSRHNGVQKIKEESVIGYLGTEAKTEHNLERCEDHWIAIINIQQYVFLSNHCSLSDFFLLFSRCLSGILSKQQNIKKGIWPASAPFQHEKSPK